MSHTLRLEHGIRAPGQARIWIIRRCHDWQCDDLAPAAALLVSELVTNVFLHARTDCLVQAAFDQSTLAVTVTDRNGKEPLLRPPSTSTEDGRGLAILEEIADAWGIQQSDGVKSVWFRLRGHSPSDSTDAESPILRGMYSDADAAALYDVLNPWAASDEFHLRHVMAAPSVLDVGCGTGMLLHRARRAGHSGRLCGVDPDEAALARARAHRDIEWLPGTAASMTFDREFAHGLMASNAFQCLVTDDELRASLTAIRAALADGGTFAFETRNPLAREWEGWNPDNAYDVVDSNGRELRLSHQVEEQAGDVVTFTETTATRDGEPLRVDRASLRFLSEEALDGFLADAGFAIAERYGDFTGGRFTADSRSIVTVARRQ